MIFSSYIVNWNSVFDNVINVENNLKSFNIPLKVINSGNFREGWENVGDIRFYRQLYFALNDFDDSYEYMLFILGDASYSDWNSFLNRANAILTSYDNIWLYAPYFTNDPWHKESSGIQDIPFDKNLTISVNTNGILFFMHKDLVKILKEFYDFFEENYGWSEMTCGWGIDIIFSALSFYNNKFIIRDATHIINHPQGSSYDHDRASEEMKIVFDYFNKFYNLKNYDIEKIQNCLDSVYGRMSRVEKYMDINSFYKEIPNYIKKNNIDYTVIHINDERLENRNRIHSIINGNNIDIKSLNAKDDSELNLFYKNNEKFHISYDQFKIGEIGNFGSHYLIWKYLVNSDLDRILVFEDDTLIHDDFIYKYNLLLKDLPEDFDVFSVFVHSNQYPRFDESHRISYNLATGYQDWSTLCYLVSKTGAQKMLNDIHTYGMGYPTDWFIFRGGHQGKFKVYTLTPTITPPLNIDERYTSQVQ